MAIPFLKYFKRTKGAISKGEKVVSKKKVVGNQIIVGSILLMSVGGLFHREVVQVEVKDINPNGDYVRLGDGIEWFAIKSLKVLDILKV